LKPASVSGLDMRATARKVRRKRQDRINVLAVEVKDVALPNYSSAPSPMF